MLNRISTADSYRVIKALEMYFIVDDEEKKLGRYRKGWSDALVARKLGTNINYNHVQRIRTQMFGHIMNAAARESIRKSQIKPLPVNTDHELILQLTNNTAERFDLLEKHLANIEATVNKLLADLGVAAEVSQSIENNDDGMFDAPK